MSETQKSRRMIQPHTPTDIAARRAAFQHYFGITQSAADVLVCLYNQRGTALTAAQLAAQSCTAAQAIPVRVWDLRQVLRCEAIDRIAEGYRLTDIGMIECRSAMDAMIKSLSDAQVRHELLEDFRL